MENSPQNKIEVSLRLLKIQEVNFVMDSDKIAGIADFNFDKINIEFGFKTDLIPAKETLILNTIVKYNYMVDSNLEKLLELETTNHFELKNLTELFEISKNSAFKDKVGIFPTLIGITIGSLRGILVTKTSGTKLLDYPLPIVNPTDICQQMNTFQNKS